MSATRTKVADLLKAHAIWPPCPDHPNARVQLDRSDASTHTHHVSCAAPGCDWTGRWPFAVAVAGRARRLS